MPGLTRARPSGWRRPCSVWASHGPATSSDQSASSSASGAPVSSSDAPATSRRASANGRPLAAAFSIASKRCSSRSSDFLFTSTQRPRSSCKPSPPLSSALMSAALKVSPSSDTSMLKSSSAPAPSSDGGRAPTLPLTLGRLGLPDFQTPGVRTTIPAASSWPMSRKKAKACSGLQRSGW